MIRGSLLAASALALVAPVLPAQQPLPTTQPAIIQITREFVKPYHGSAHVETEARWAAHLRAHNAPTSYLGLEAQSGASEAWYLSAYTGLDALGKSIGFGSDNSAFTAAMSKISLEDGEHLTNVTVMQAAAVPDASHGAFPDLKSLRVVEISTVTLRTGQDAAFTELTKRYIALLQSKGVNSAWRTYSVIAGGPGGTLLIFSSYPSWDALEANRKAVDGAFATASPVDLAALSKGWADAVANVNTRYFTVNPKMSLVQKELMNDPFWAGK